MELTIEQKHANYLKEMQRDNNIVASELKTAVEQVRKLKGEFKEHTSSNHSV